ncbi:DUF368 domain-containing protein [Salipaludibacillus aurantiacus]|uniref:Putative membrane protein n=1 Tax=Salipaludibacillus aurantiacus TaxID=1601833 RepID=A0A1H9RK91_9BACI|nr:DUF368 domain-containing protein [Salipaludibacillus aurantiacus]SER73057.1 putative membrane protein [Salipaludibacillus aurantiacus]
MEWKNIYRGMLMGVSNIIPGVSAGTIALVLGIYDRLIVSISDFFSPRWRQTLGFLIPLGIGIIGAIMAFGRLITWLITHFEQPTQFFFLGLIIGVVPLLFKQSDMKKKFKAVHYTVLILTASLVGTIGIVNPDETAVVLDLTMVNGIWFFIAGWVASMSLLLPGMSGALVLILFGVYYTAMNALATLDLPVIFILASGIIVGFVISSKFIKYLLNNFPYMTYAAIIGLLLGSCVLVYPGFGNGGAAVFPSLLTFAAGAYTALMLGSKK